MVASEHGRQSRGCCPARGASVQEWGRWMLALTHQRSALVEPRVPIVRHKHRVCHRAACCGTPSPWTTLPHPCRTVSKFTCGTIPAGSTCTNVSSRYRSCGAGQRQMGRCGCEGQSETARPGTAPGSTAKWRQLVGRMRAPQLDAWQQGCAHTFTHSGPGACLQVHAQVGRSGAASKLHVARRLHATGHRHQVGREAARTQNHGSANQVKSNDEPMLGLRSG